MVPQNVFRLVNDTTPLATARSVGLDFSRVFWECFEGDSSKFQGSFKEVFRGFKSVILKLSS